MPRRQLDLPDPLDFQTDITVRITDINYGGHLGNDALLRLIHEARFQFLQSLGYTEADVDGCGTIMLDAELIFSSEAFAGEVLTVSVGAAHPRRTGCDVFFLLTESASGREVGRARTGMAFFDYESRKPQRMPMSFRDQCFPG